MCVPRALIKDLSEQPPPGNWNIKQKKQELRASSLDTTVASMLVWGRTLIGGPRRKLPGLLFCTFPPQSTQILRSEFWFPNRGGHGGNLWLLYWDGERIGKKEPILAECIWWGWLLAGRIQIKCSCLTHILQTQFLFPTLWLLSLTPTDLLFYSIQLLSEMEQRSILLTNCATPFHAHILTCLFMNRNHELLWDRPLKWKICSTRVLLLLFSYILAVCLCKHKAGRKQLAFGRE